MLKLKEYLNMSLNGEMIEEIGSFKYLGVLIGKKGDVEENVTVRVNEGT